MDYSATHISIQNKDCIPYIPFAKNRIKQMRESGMKFGSKTFIVGSFMIRATIEDGNSYVRILDRDAAPVGLDTLHRIGMDSGIVDVGFWSQDQSVRLDPGLLTKTAMVEGYEAGFTDGTNTPYWANPRKGIAGQLSGAIKVESRFIEGLIRKDSTARSFGPSDRVPGQQVGETLASKKKAGDLCPPSMFTGRAKLYAQALYGKYLYRDDTLEPTVGYIAPGVISLPAYNDLNIERKNAFQAAVNADYAAAQQDGRILVWSSPYQVTLNINSGIFLDPDTRKHWLINPSAGSINIYPLAVTPEGLDAYRIFASRALSMSQDDRDRLEAYILSVSLPHVELMTTVQLSSNISPYASGYGWHWNWSGTCADMVQYSSGSFGGSSSHYRLVVSKQGNSWSAFVAVIEGGKRWFTWRTICCWTHPNWTNRTMNYNAIDPLPTYWSEKGPAQVSGWAQAFSCDAPIYAFYIGDELQVARYSLSMEKVDRRNIKFTPGYATWLNPGETYHLYYAVRGGSGSGSFEDTIEKYTKYTHKISLNGTSVCVSHGYQKTGSKSVTTPLGFIEYSPSEGSAPSSWGTNGLINIGQSVPEGYPIGLSNNHRMVNVAAPYNGLVRLFHQYKIHLYKVVHTGIYEYDSGFAGAIIPFYDAQAFYLFQDTCRNELNSGMVRGTFSGAAGVLIHTATTDMYGETSVGDDYDSDYWVAPVNPVGEQEHIASEHVKSNEVKIIYSCTGAVLSSSSTVPSGVFSMFENGDEEYVGDTYKTLSSAGSGKLVWGMVRNNWPAQNFDRPVIVGWV